MPGLGSHPGLSMSIGIALITRGFAFVGAGEIQISVSQPFMVTSGDFDGNGLPDFAVSSLFANSVGILLNDGKGGFLPQLTRVKVGVQPIIVQTADLDLDGALDLVVGNIGSGSAT